MKPTKDLMQYLIIFLIGGGLIGGIMELTIYVNKLFMYPIGFGLSVLIVLSVFELIERSRDDR